jgi:hypothetical protein
MLDDAEEYGESDMARWAMNVGSDPADSDREGLEGF